MQKFKKIVYISQFAFVLIPLAVFVCDVAPYIIRKRSIIDGFGTLLYDSMLNCSDNNSGIVIFILIVISIASFIVNLMIRTGNNKKNKEKGQN